MIKEWYWLCFISEEHSVTYYNVRFQNISEKKLYPSLFIYFVILVYSVISVYKCKHNFLYCHLITFKIHEVSF
jgi:hypothetical protein